VKSNDRREPAKDASQYDEYDCPTAADMEQSPVKAPPGIEASIKAAMARARAKKD